LVSPRARFKGHRRGDPRERVCPLQQGNAAIRALATSPRVADGGFSMGSGTIDKAKGRAKEAAGALTGDRKLKSEGKVDQAVGKVKDAVDRVADKAKRTLGKKR